jgi:hypothetical protein
MMARIWGAPGDGSIDRSYHGGACRVRPAAAGTSLPLFPAFSFWENKEGSLPLPSQCGLIFLYFHPQFTPFFTTAIDFNCPLPLIPKKTRWPPCD